MGRFKSLVFGLLVLLSGNCRLIQAATLSQTFNFSDTATVSGSGKIVHANSSGIISTNFNPFNSSLGTLMSFKIDWTATVTASGTTSATGGSFSPSLGGTLYIGANSYGGDGGGNGTGGGPNTFVGPISAGINNSNSFLVSNAGVTYNANILSTVTGGSPFNIRYSNGSGDTIFTSYTNMASTTSTLTGSVTLTYTYEAASVPEPTSFSIGSLLCTSLIAMRRRKARIS